MVGICFGGSQRKKLSSHMAHISEHTNYSNHKILFNNKINKMVVDLGSKKGESNYNCSSQLTRLHNSLLVSFVNTIETYLSNVDRKSGMKKLHTSLVQSSSTIFSCSIRSIYNIVIHTKKQRLMLKLCLPGINTLILLKRHYDNLFYEKLLN